MAFKIQKPQLRCFHHAYKYYMRTIYIIIIFFFVGCATGRQMSKVNIGMTQDDVTRAIGKPKGVGSNKEGSYWVYNYANKAGLPVSAGRTNYYVMFKNGKVDSFGPLSTLKN